MGSSASKNEEINDVKAVQEMDETEMSSKDKMFKKAIVEIYEELKKVKDQKKDKFIYTVPKVDLCNWSLFWLNNIITIILSNLIIYDYLFVKSNFKHIVNIRLHKIYK